MCLLNDKIVSAWSANGLSLSLSRFRKWLNFSVLTLHGFSFWLATELLWRRQRQEGSPTARRPPLDHWGCAAVETPVLQAVVFLTVSADCVMMSWEIPWHSTGEKGSSSKSINFFLNNLSGPSLGLGKALDHGEGKMLVMAGSGRLVGFVGNVCASFGFESGWW